MSHDDLLSRLGRVARDEAERETRELDERWDALARGELSEAEAEELRRENPQAYEAFRPLEEGFKDQVMERLRERPPGRALAFPGRRPTWGWVVAASGLAAVLVLLILLPAVPAALPGYALVVEGGARTLRSEAPAEAPSGPAEATRLGPGDRLEVLLRPETAVAGRVEARAWLEIEGSGEIRDLTGRLRVADSGAVRLVGTVGRDLDWPPGRLDLWIAVGRPGRVPGPEASAFEAQDGVWRIPLWIEP